MLYSYINTLIASKDQIVVFPLVYPSWGLLRKFELSSRYTYTCSVPCVARSRTSMSSRNFCPVCEIFCSLRELDPIDELTSEHGVELTSLKLEASMPFYDYPL